MVSELSTSRCGQEERTQAEEEAGGRFDNLSDREDQRGRRSEGRARMKP
jgi:hypothetical protein